MKHARYMAALLALILSVGAVSCEKKDADKTDGHGTAGTGLSVPAGGTSVTPETAPTVSIPTEPVVGEVGGNASDKSEADGTGTPSNGTPTVGDLENPTAGTVTNASGATVITLSDTIGIDGEGASVSGHTVTIGRAGTYVVTGTLSDGQLVVDTTDAGRVTVILNGASLTCSSGPAVFVKAAEKKVIFETAQGSVNLLADAAGYVVADDAQVEGEIYPNATLYACADIELGGVGELYITGNADKGINTKDDLTLTSGTVVVSSVGAGIRANDNLTVGGGTVTVVSSGDGIKTANAEKAGKGRICVNDGALYVTARGDALSAATDLAVFGGTLVLNTLDENGEALREASANPTTGSSGMGGGMGGFPGGGRPGMPGESSSDKAAISAKGIKAAGELHIAGGRITIVAQDDGLHTNGNLTVSGGSVYIRAADDGMHADGELVISGGTNEIAQSYEGLEALHITISGGESRITASDDGANATDGSGGGFGGGFGGGGRPGTWGGSSGSIEFSEEQPCLTFAGGYTVFNAAGDGIDSNGWIKMTGGTVLVYGPTDNGNGPIDTGDGGYTMTVSGGTFLAVGSSGMAESAENGGQAVVAAYWNRTGLSAGEIVGIVDADGHVLAAFELPKAIASIVFSSSEIEAGKTYSIVSGGTFNGNAVDGVVDASTYSGFESMGEVDAY